MNTHKVQRGKREQLGGRAVQKHFGSKRKSQVGSSCEKTGGHWQPPISLESSFFFLSHALDFVLLLAGTGASPRTTRCHSRS
jgi:hypothetical protein